MNPRCNIQARRRRKWRENTRILTYSMRNFFWTITDTSDDTSDVIERPTIERPFDYECIRLVGATKDTITLSRGPLTEENFIRDVIEPCLRTHKKILNVFPRHHGLFEWAMERKRQEGEEP